MSVFYREKLRSGERMKQQGTVGIELLGVLKPRKLLIPLNAKNAKNTRFAEMRYTPGTPTGKSRTLNSGI